MENKLDLESNPFFDLNMWRQRDKVAIYFYFFSIVQEVELALIKEYSRRPMCYITHGSTPYRGTRGTFLWFPMENNQDLVTRGEDQI